MGFKVDEKTKNPYVKFEMKSTMTTSRHPIIHIVSYYINQSSSTPSPSHTWSYWVGADQISWRESTTLRNYYLLQSLLSSFLLPPSTSCVAIAILANDTIFHIIFHVHTSSPPNPVEWGGGGHHFPMGHRSFDILHQYKYHEFSHPMNFHAKSQSARMAPKRKDGTTCAGIDCSC